MSGKVDLTGDWKIVMPFFRMLTVVSPGILQRAVMQEALKYEGEIKQRIITQAIVPPKLSKMTLQLRALQQGAGPVKINARGRQTVDGTTKALIASGALIRSIKAQVVQRKGRVGFTILTGVNRNSRRKGAKGFSGKLVNIASVHEFGSKPFYVNVTPKLRRFWMMLFLRGIVSAPLPANKTRIGPIQIPARPYIGPVFKANRAATPKRIQQRAYAEFQKLVNKFGGKKR